jgi:hypothetical protein
MMPGGMNFPGMNGGMPQSAAEQQQQQEKQKAADEQRMQILKALLTPGARERRVCLAPALFLSLLSLSLSLSLSFCHPPTLSPNPRPSAKEALRSFPLCVNTDTHLHTRKAQR